jgi:ABC-type multidrug transport system fused ATPase/permease subunit
LTSASEIATGLNAAEDVFKLLDYPSKINAVEMDEDNKGIRLEPEELDKNGEKILTREDGSKKHPDILGRIEFKDVWFRYPTRKEDFVLRGMNLTINEGETVALTGESGCGKSTFINLMMRFYDPNFGDIYLDGKNIKDYNLHDLRNRVSLVMQEPLIFNYSIAENLLYSKLNASNSDIIKNA